MDSQEAFITIQFGLKKTTEEIITLLQQNFTLSREDAENKIKNFLNDAQVEMSILDSLMLISTRSVKCTTTIAHTCECCLHSATDATTSNTTSQLLKFEYSNTVNLMMK